MRSYRLVLALAATLAVSHVHQPATAAEVSAAAYQFSGPEAFSGEELIASGHHFFGTASKGLAMTVQEAVRRWGEPNGYIVGQEASAAVFGGLRYGEGMLFTRNAGERRIYWQGPSLGFDLGGDGGRTMMLVYSLGSSGRRNTLREEVAMASRKRRSDRSGRGALPSPGRPSVARREDHRHFWAAIAAGCSSEDAAVGAGVSPAVGARWFRRAGGMPPSHLAPAAKPLSGRSLSFAEREEIAIWRAQRHGVREIAISS